MKKTKQLTKTIEWYPYANKKPIRKLLDENTIEIIKDIYTEAIHLFTSFVKAKPDNDDLLMAKSALPEEAKKQL